MSRRESERGEEWRVKSGEAQSGKEGLCQRFLENFTYFRREVYVSKWGRKLWFWKCSICKQNITVVL